MVNFIIYYNVFKLNHYLLMSISWTLAFFAELRPYLKQVKIILIVLYCKKIDKNKPCGWSTFEDFFI
jgi:hypothetical protein